MKLCNAVANCEKLAEKRGWCGMHYRRWQRHGSFDERPRTFLTEKLCKGCNVVKPRSEYYVAKAEGGPNGVIGGLCKVCFNAHQEEYRQARLQEDLANKRQYRRNNIDYWRQVDRDRERDPEQVRAAGRRSASKRRALLRGAVTVAFTQDQLDDKLRYWGDKCWMCDKPWEEVDHVKPLNKGGAHMLCNFRPICKFCNRSKSDSWPLVGVV